MSMTRAQFLRTTLGAVVLVGCGGDDGGDPPPVDAADHVCTTPTGSISSNHGHALTVSLADVDAAADKTYDITGGATHSHSVTVTAAQFAQIKDGQTVMVTSTSGSGHTHSVSVLCAS